VLPEIKGSLCDVAWSLCGKKKKKMDTDGMLLVAGTRNVFWRGRLGSLSLTGKNRGPGRKKR